jgi:hypothetical protein
MAAPFPEPPAYVQWPAHPLTLAAMPPTGIPPPAIPPVVATARLDELVYLPQVRQPNNRGNKRYTQGTQGTPSMRHDESWYGQDVPSSRAPTALAALVSERETISLPLPDTAHSIAAS